MMRRLFAISLALVAPASIPEGVQPVVLKLYKQVVARRPLGIPKGRDKAAIDSFLSRALVQRLQTAQACEDDYFRQNPEKDSKPAFPWLELGLFSGANEQAIPSAVEVVRTEQKVDGSSRVFLRLTYKESSHTYSAKPADPAKAFHWQVAAIVKSENGRFVVDDVLFLDDTSTKVESRLSDSFTGCDGSHWVGDKN